MKTKSKKWNLNRAGTLSSSIRIFFVIFSFFFWKTSEATELNIPTVFRTLTTENGLSSNHIYSIFKDSKGFIWTCSETSGIINRFDGVDVKQFKISDIGSTLCMAESDSILLWVGGQFGLKRLNRMTGNIETISLDQTSISVKDIEPIDAERLIIATNNGLYLIDKDRKVERIVFENSLSASNNLTSIVKGDKDVYWISTQNGIACFDLKTKKTQVFKAELGHPECNNFTCLTIHDSILYSGTYNWGVLSFNTKTEIFENLSHFQNYYILNITYHDDKLFIGTNGKGLKIYSLKTNEIQTIKHEVGNYASICSNAIYSFLIDQDIFWIGTYRNGLSYNQRINDRFHSYKYKNFNSSDYSVRSFWINDNGDRLIGARDGFIYISESRNMIKKITQQDDNRELRADIILHIYPYKNNYLIGTYGGGMYLFDPQKLSLSRLFNEDVFITGCVFRFLTDHAGILWIGTDKGLYAYNPIKGTIKKYDTSNSGLRNNIVISLGEDSFNRMWLGTPDQLYVLDKTSGVIRADLFGNEFSDFLKHVNYIFEDSDKYIWICSNGGLLKIDQSLSHITIESENSLIAGSSVTSIVEDNDKNLWIATSRGIVRYTPSDKSFFIYGTSDGIPEYEFPNVVQKTSQNTIWWANERGLIYCSLSNIGKNAIQSNPIITGFYIAKKEIATNDKFFIAAEHTKNWNLSAKENSIGFRFSLLNYSFPKSEVYEYKLDNFDQKWQTVIGENEVYYNNLPPGNYVFHLKSANSNEETTLKIKMNRDYTTFVWIGIILLIISISTILYKKRKVIAWEIRKSSHNNKYQNYKTEQLNANEIIEQLSDYMRKEKPYLNPDFKQPDVAKILNISSTELSIVMSQYLGVNFSDFVNKYRIEELTSLMREQSSSKYTLQALSEQCGFNSRSSFFRALKKQTGQSPSAYFKAMGIKSKEL